jgi:hypothetical protein
MDQNEFDSGDEAVMCGPNCVLISDPDEYVTVICAVMRQSPWVPIGSIVLAWVNLEMSEVTILVFSEPLYLATIWNVTLYGVVVLDPPECSSHASYVPGEGQRFPLDMKGVVLYFESCKPSTEELRNCWREILMSDRPWDPHDLAFE